MPRHSYLLAPLLLLPLLAANNLNGDEGLILEGAWRLYQGERIYADFFEFTPPGSFYLVWLVWQFLGPSYWAAKLLALANLAAASGGIYLLGKKLGGKQAGLLPAGFFLLLAAAWPLINHNLFNLCLIIWSSYCFLLYLDGGRNKQLLMSGFLLGLSGLFLLHKTLLVFGFSLIFLLWQQLRHKKIGWASLARYAGLFLLPLLPLLAWPPRLLSYDLIVFPLFNYTEANRTGPFYLAAALAVVGLALLSRPARTRNASYLLLLQAALLLPTVSRPDAFHVALALFPLYVLGPTLFSSEAWAKPLARKAFLFGCLALISALAYPSLATYRHKLSITPFKTSETYRLISDRCADSEYLYAGPFAPGAYFEFGKKNPTAFPFLITNMNTPEQFELAARQLEEKKPACAILNYRLAEKFGHNPGNPVDQFIHDRYYLLDRSADVEIYRIKP